ncbi:hypothetical protein EG68_02900 [Paragonimus skrjabini miyazakii]|uniref:Ceramide kinase C-terminal domain-containing protein n=1 Tax=Paragonimus skrjabini miyazakii TaxID=59628 RepID=A0A8S9YX82_9TREM|nr:hypothetical protein EG68_02900 [Paragonimus skrjabini miyazakii]
MVGYGFHADLLKNDDKLRWMGPRRYDCSGLSAFLSHLTYTGEISYLPSSNHDSHSRDGVLCAVGCSVCSSHTLCRSGNDSKSHLTLIREKKKKHLMNGVLPRSSSMMSKCRTDPQLLFSPSVRTHEWSERSSTVQFYLGVRKSDTHVSSMEPEVEPTHISVDTDSPASSGSHSRYFIVRQQQKPSCRSESLHISMENGFDSSSNEASPISTRLVPNRSTLHPSPSWSIQGCSKGWRTVTGCFVAINAFIQSCRCVKAMAGPSPWAHLGDGCLDLILVHNCSRRQFLQYLIRVANGSNQTSCQRSRPGNESPFELPFVTVERVCAFKFRSMSSIPTVRSLDSMRDHNQLIADSAAVHERAHSFSDTGRKPICKPPHKVPSSKKLPESIWCADGELVHHTNVAVFVHRQLLRLYARGPEPLFQDALLGPTMNTDAQSGKLFDAVATAFARTDRLNDPAVVTQFDSN